LTKFQKPLQEGYPQEPEFQNSEYLVLFLDPKLLHKSAIRFVLWLNSLNKIFIMPFWVGICMGGTLKTQSFGNLNTELFFKCKKAEQKSHQFSSMMKYLNKTEQNCVFALFHIQDPKARLRFEVLFKKCHPRINLTTLFFTKSYLLNAMKAFSGHQNHSLSKSQKPLQGGVPLGTWISKF
jgi:hypothetical protein